MVEVQEPVVEVHDPVVELQESEEEVVIIPVKKRKTRWLERIIFILIILGSIGLVAYLFRADIKKFYDQKFNKNRYNQLD